MRLVSRLSVLALLPLVTACADREPAVGPAADRGETATVRSETVSGEADPAAGTDGPPRLLSAEEVADGWIALFDGHSLFGWRPSSEMNWRVEDGVIVADDGEPGLLVTRAEFADYELRCEYRLEPGGNSGVFLRSLFDPQDPATDCYELNMADVHPAYPTGSIVGRQKVGRPVQGEGEWKTWHVRVEGPRITARLDGEPVIDFTDDSDHQRPVGHVGLQMNGGRVEFRSVFLRPLGGRPIFNGEDLTGWRPVPGSQSRFEVADGTIHLRGGPGYLETEDAWDDFILQAEIRTNRPDVNSGIFFRALPGTEEAPANGYEFQIHNKYRDGDRTRPVDFGTGGIFRRAPARRVVADDDEWFTATLIAHGPTLATWVNGYPVVAGADSREPHENPRQGLRLEAGHLSLQGHDETSDVSFRNLRIVEFPPEPETSRGSASAGQADP